MRFQLLAIALSSAAVLGCTAASSSPSPTASGTSGGGNGEVSGLSELVEETVWPSVQPSGAGVAVELAETGQSTRVGPSGGSVEVVGQDGTRYTLTIPANAVTFETDIRMTPVEAVTGYSVASDAMYAVDIAPHGLMLWSAATLEVVPAADTDLSHAVALAYDGSGANLHRTPLGRDSSKLEIVVAHFSGGLVYVGDGIFLPALPDPEPLSYDALQKAAAEVIDRERAGDATPDETSAALEALFDQYIRDSLLPSAARMRQDCNYGKQHLWEYIAVIRQAQLLGMDYVIERHTDDVSGLIVAGDVIEVCWGDATGECVRYDPAQIREIIGLLRQAQIIGRDLDVEQYEPTVCGNTGGQVTWSNDGTTVRVYDPYTLNVKDRYEATVWVTGQWSDGTYEDRGSRYTYQGLTRESEVGGACDVHIVNRTFGEGQALDVVLEVTGTEAYFSAYVDGTAHGNRSDCDGATYEDQPNFGALVTCPDESGGVTGTFDVANQRVVFNCDATTTEEGDATVSTTFAVHGSLSMQGYQDIVDFIKAQAQAQ